MAYKAITAGLTKSVYLAHLIAETGHKAVYSPCTPRVVMTDAPQSIVRKAYQLVDRILEKDLPNSTRRLRRNPEVSEYRMSGKTAEQLKADYRTSQYPAEYYIPPALLSSSEKTIKGEKFGWKTGILYLAPASTSGIQVGGKRVTLCAKASPQCEGMCLISSGQMTFISSQISRINKTIFMFKEPDRFMSMLYRECLAIQRLGKKRGGKVCVRLNGTSDIPWETGSYMGIPLIVPETKKTIFESIPSLQFYDYTKIFPRMQPTSRARQLKNYDLTFSRSEGNEDECRKVLAMKQNVAAVFFRGAKDKKSGTWPISFPRTYMGVPVIDGDESDLRFLDPKPRVVGLSAKGLALKYKDIIEETYGTAEGEEFINKDKSPTIAREGFVIARFEQDNS